MMQGETIQPTPVSKEEYIKFKQWVQDVHGKTRGHLSTEIENALREYRQPDSTADQITRMEDDIATLKAYVIESESDGGTCVEPDTPARTDSNKPAANQPRKEKINWFIDDKYDRDGASIITGCLKDDLKEAFGFDEGVIDEYVDLFISEVDGRIHPNNEDMIVWGSRIDEIKELCDNE